ncbi:unnamed protein product, partial [Allacma fusca]
MVKETLTLMR